MKPDHYAVLGVSPGASLSSIRAAFRAQARRAHPDHGGSHQRMIEVLEAWEVLSDLAARREYDRHRSSATRPAAPTRAAQAARRRAERHAEACPTDSSLLDAWLEEFEKELQADDEIEREVVQIRRPTGARLVFFVVVFVVLLLIAAIPVVLILADEKNHHEGRKLLRAFVGMGYLAVICIGSHLLSERFKSEFPTGDKVKTEPDSLGKKLTVIALGLAALAGIALFSKDDDRTFRASFWIVATCGVLLFKAIRSFVRVLLWRAFTRGNPPPPDVRSDE